MNIGLDIMGGDFAPEAAVQGALLFLQQNTDPQIKLTLIGNKDKVAPYMHILDAYTDQFTFMHAPSTIEMNEHPTKALKEKQDSSIAIGFGLLQLKKIDAFIGAGNTGAMLVGAMYTVKAIEGVLRPTIASPIPSINGHTNFLVDVGANADCKAEHLVQFAEMGSLYVQHVLKVDRPRVALLNIGEEEGKGNILAQSTYPLLKAHNDIHFVGNIEGRHLFTNHSDVTVCEGFTGNVMLKLAESFYDIFAVSKGMKDELLDRFNYETYGGTPILGVNAPVIIGHGISKASVFNEMIVESIKIVTSNLIPILQSHFSKQANTAIASA
jgi:glycerol-3-phosphate acyltransferase PlsX